MGKKRDYEKDVCSWHPFRARYKGYDDTMVNVIFTCSQCGGHNIVERESKHFFEGNFKCEDCRCTKSTLRSLWDGKRINLNYYSPEFKEIRTPIKPETKNPKVIELSLF